MISTCPSCDKKLKTPEGDEGRTIRCPGCKTTLVVTEDGLALPEEDEAPRRSRRREEEEDEDDRPRRSRRRDEDEDDYDRSRRRDEEDEDDSPRRRSRKRKSGGVPLWVWLSIGGGVLTVTLIVILLIVFMGGSDKIKVGMTEAEVNSALGPAFLQVDANHVVYMDPPMTMADAMANLEKAGKAKARYLVIFEGGKVKKYKKEDPHAKSGKESWDF